MLRLSHAHLCSEHFAECDFVNFMAEYQMGLSHAHLCSEHFENLMTEYQIGFASKRNLKHINTQISILLLCFLYLFVELMIMMYV